MALIISQQTICSLHPTHLIINLTEIHIHHFLVGWRERTWDLGLILLCLGPSPGPILPDADGFNRIDLLGVWECALSPFRAMEEVLGMFREKWAGVLNTILRRLEQSAKPEEKVRALKWFLIHRHSSENPRKEARRVRTRLPSTPGLTLS